MWRVFSSRVARGVGELAGRTMARGSEWTARTVMVAAARGAMPMAPTRMVAGLSSGAGMVWARTCTGVPASVTVQEKTARYEGLLDRFVEDRNVNKVFSLLNEMRMEGLRIPKGVCNQVMDMVSRDRLMGRVYDVFEMMRLNGTPIDAVHYNMAIGACLHTDNLPHALSLVREMRNAGIELTPRTYSSFITAFGKLGDLDKSRAYLEEAEMHGLANSHVYFALMASLERSNDAEGVYGVFNRMVQRGIPPTVQCFNVLLALCVRNNALDKAVDVMHQMAAIGVTPDRLSRSLLMNGLAASGHYDELCEVVRSMEAEAMEPMNKALSRVIGHFTQDDTRADPLTQFLSLVPELWYGPPRRYALNAALSKLMNLELKGLTAEHHDADAVVRRVYTQLDRHALVLPQTTLLFERWLVERVAALEAGPSEEVLAGIEASKAAAAAEQQALVEAASVDNDDSELSDGTETSDEGGSEGSDSSLNDEGSSEVTDEDSPSDDSSLSDGGSVSETGYLPSSDNDGSSSSSSSSSSDSEGGSDSDSDSDSDFFDTKKEEQ